MRFNLLVLFVLLSQYGWAQKSWKTFNAEQGAFSVDFPGDPEVTSVNRPTPEGIDIKVNIHMVTAESTVAYVIYNEFPTGFNILDDSLYLQEVARETVLRMKLDTSAIKKITFAGYPGRKFESKVKDGVTEMRVILRGNRVYIVAGFFPNKRKDDLARFINSFKFTPYKKAEWKAHQFAEYSFSAEFPGEPVLEEDEESGSTMKAYSGKDVNSGNNYSVAIESYSKYDQFESDSAILAARTFPYTSAYDSVLLDRDVIVDGRPAKEMIFLQGGNHTQLRILTFARGLTGYTLFVFLPPSEIKSDDANRFFRSFKFTGKATGDLLSDKSALLLKDIASKDTAVWKPAAAAFSDYAFKEKDVEAIHNLIKQPYSDDRESERSRKEIMFDALEGISSEKSIAFIEKIFPSLSINPALEFAALKALSQIGSKASLTTLIKLLEKHKPVTDDEWSYNLLFSPYSIDSVNQKFFLLNTLKYLPVKQYKTGIYMLAEHLLENKTLAIAELSAHKKIIVQDFQADSEVYLRDSTYQSLYYLTEILGYEPQAPAEIATLKKLTQGFDDYMAVAAATTLFRLKQTPDAARVTELARNLPTRVTFFSGLQEHSLEQHFPKQYANQDSLAVGEFYDYLVGEYDYSEDFNVEIAYKAELNYEGAKKKFYVMRFHDTYEDVTYLGICGPYATDKLQVWGGLTSSDFVKDTGKDYKLYLNNYLKSLEETE
jgi:hypothetical protein